MSNWSLPGYGARHNIGYWRNLPYLGVGPGAHSSLGRYRFWQVSSPRLYVSKVKEWAGSDPQPFEAMDGEVLDTACPVGSWEHIDINTGCAETMFLGLRLLDGLYLAGATEDVGVDLE